MHFPLIVLKTGCIRYYHLKQRPFSHKESTRFYTNPFVIKKPCTLYKFKLGRIENCQCQSGRSILYSSSNGRVRQVIDSSGGFLFIGFCFAAIRMVYPFVRMYGTPPGYQGKAPRKLYTIIIG